MKKIKTKQNKKTNKQTNSTTFEAWHVLAPVYVPITCRALSYNTV